MGSWSILAGYGLVCTLNILFVILLGMWFLK